MDVEDRDKLAWALMRVARWAQPNAPPILTHVQVESISSVHEELSDALAAIELPLSDDKRALIQKEFERRGRNAIKTAKKLGVSRYTIYRALGTSSKVGSHDS